MKTFKFEPVRWATGALALVSALLGADAAIHVIPNGVLPYLLFAQAILALLLGKAVRDRVTPLAAPRDASERPLVPKPPVL